MLKKKFTKNIENIRSQINEFKDLTGMKNNLSFI